MEITISKARENLSEIVNETAFGKKQFVLNRRGKRVAAIIPIDDYDELKRNKASKPQSNKESGE